VVLAERRTAAQQTGLLDAVVKPALKRHKVKYESAIIDVAADDVVAAEQQAGVIAQRFQEEGIKTVLVVGNSVQVVASALEKTDYRPRLLATDRETYLGYVANPGHSKEVLKGAVSGGPASDFDEPGRARCRKLVEKKIGDTIIPEADVPKGDPAPDVSATNACFTIGLFAAIAEAAGKKLTVDSFGAAGRAMKEVYIPSYGTVAYDPKTNSYALPIKLTRYDPKRDDSVEDAKPIKTSS
jgi:hypothetical protein